MADMADMDSILDQALDDLENVDATMSYMNSASINPLENEQMAGAKPTAHYRAKVQRPNGIGDEPLDPEKFLRDLIEGGEEELDEVDREVKLDEFIKQIQSKFCEDVGDAEAKNPKTKDMGNQVDDEDDVAATLASILEQMTTIDDQDDSYLKEAANFQPDAIVDGMMEQLLSKELMYEPMKQVADLFPAWLEANENILSESDLER